MKGCSASSYESEKSFEMSLFCVMGDLFICICLGELHFPKDPKGVTMLTHGMLPPPFPPTDAEVKHFWLFIYSLPFKS